MAEVTIYHNPRCSTSNHAMSVAGELGVDADVVLYLTTPPDAATLTSIIDRLEDPVTELVRRDALWTELGLTDADVATREQVVDVLLRHPRLMQRPVLVKCDMRDHRPAEGARPAAARLTGGPHPPVRAAGRPRTVLTVAMAHLGVAELTQLGRSLSRSPRRTAPRPITSTGAARGGLRRARTRARTPGGRCPRS